LVFKSQVPSCVFFGLKSRYLFIFSGLQSHYSQGHLGNFSNCFTCNGRPQGGEHPLLLRCERLPVGRRYLLCFFLGEHKNRPDWHVVGRTLKLGPMVVEDMTRFSFPCLWVWTIEPQTFVGTKKGFSIEPSP
jgi:hypothetical protein